ncbi:flagellar biosynthetic protein FliR [Paenibacillus eucommiae]|uniref:Flagellar biosynthetic protein FliR n=1 Tax=Paenibacillus eucommiae TaxID=1355755 RepID=A0ABS4IUT1_9BACL|nr:flagellar biosynthetic protein FliR [Paenibacillus eucommiae]MBP1991323.1 flagellar biosynthetic protein FliR [Paenibacillus eucommiae]
MELFFQTWPNLLLIFCRMTSFFVVVPFFSSRNIPTTVKIGLAAFLSFITFGIVGASNPVPIDSIYVLLILREILVGVLLGFVIYLFFTAVQIAGAFVDIQMGFAIANVIDPMTGSSAPMLGNMKFMVSLLIFLSFDGHHYLIRAIIDSYQWIPLDNELFTRIYNGQISDFLFKSFSTMFYLAFQIGAPLVAAFFLTDLGLGLLTRVAPQFNVFVVGMPLKMLLGFLLLYLLFPELPSLFQHLYVTAFDSLGELIELISKPQPAAP